MKTLKFSYILFIGWFFISCEGYLDLKPDKQMAVPSTVATLQQLLDNYNSFNATYPYAFGILADDYYVTAQHWEALSNQMLRNLYVWEPDENTADFWSTPYNRIYTINVVLEEAERIITKTSEVVDLQHVKGNAMFLRAYLYFGLSQLFTLPYEEERADEILGLPLHQKADYSIKSVRSSLSETYRFIINDLQRSVSLLPERSVLKSRPSKAAAYGLLAKVYLSMRNYEQAGLYADSCLSHYGTLMDYSQLDVDALAPISQFNEEIIFQMRSSRPSILLSSRAKVDTTLYRSYDEGDMRARLFFQANADGSVAFKGDYDGRGAAANGYVFAGVVTDEMYLIRSEAYARQNQLEEAADALNHLLIKRWESDYFQPVVFQTADQAVRTILRERWKQLLFRDSRWMDIRRLSLEPEYAVTPKRILGEQVYSVGPGQPYVLLIPTYVIERSGIQQN